MKGQLRYLYPFNNRFLADELERRWKILSQGKRGLLGTIALVLGPVKGLIMLYSA